MNVVFSESTGEYLNKNSQKEISSSNKEKYKEIGESIEQPNLIDT